MKHHSYNTNCLHCRWSSLKAGQRWKVFSWYVGIWLKINSILKRAERKLSHIINHDTTIIFDIKYELHSNNHYLICQEKYCQLLSVIFLTKQFKSMCVSVCNYLYSMLYSYIVFKCCMRLLFCTNALQQSKP